MSEKTFRAVVAAVLVGALALAFVVTVVTLSPRSPEPLPGLTIVTSPSPTVVVTPIAGPVFETPDVVSVGIITRGSASRTTLRFEFVESNAKAIPNAPGAFLVTIKDHEADGSTVAFVGTPSVVAPGSLGAAAKLIRVNVLMVEIVASDPLNIESLTITGLGIAATTTAAIGPLTAEVGDFEGSLATGFSGETVPAPGTVIALP
jgi:hypothetical protein